MKLINFNQTGGFPLSSNILAEMQNAYRIFHSFGMLSGEKTIVSGCYKTGSNISDGYIFVYGELFYFKGGTEINSIKQVSTSVEKIFEDGISKQVILERYYEFGTSTINELKWSDFSRSYTLVEITQKLKQLEGLEIPTGASESEVEAGISTTKFVTPATLPDSDFLLSGRVTSSGSRTNYHKKIFTSTKTGTGSYRITHNLGHTNYGVNATGISTSGNIKSGIKTISSNYCDVAFSDDLTLNDAAFVFHIYKI